MIKSFRGKHPAVAENVYVAENAAVIGDVTLAGGASVWFGAALRGDEDSIVVGEDSNIQDNATVHCDFGHPAVIGRGVTIGHNAVVHGCTVGDNVIVGMHATLLNGCVIGANSVIGAGALVTQGKVIPEGSVVMGVPGKVVATLNEEQIAGNRRNAEEYVKLAAEYRTI